MTQGGDMEWAKLNECDLWRENKVCDDTVLTCKSLRTTGLKGRDMFVILYRREVLSYLIDIFKVIMNVLWNRVYGVCWGRSLTLREVLDKLILLTMFRWGLCSYLQSCWTSTHPDYQRGSNNVISSSALRGGGRGRISKIDGHFERNEQRKKEVWQQEKD